MPVEDEAVEETWLDRFFWWRYHHWLSWRRWKSFFRVRTPLGHFSKWRMGDGEHCLFCKLCRRWPALQRVIPYSYYGTLMCHACGRRRNLREGESLRDGITCPCGGPCY